MTELKTSPVLFNAVNHTYWNKKKQLKGITGIISEYICPNKYSNVPDYVLNKAAERGQAIHEDIEKFVFTGYHLLPETILYHQLMLENNIIHLDSEYLVSDEENFATMIDKVDLNFNLYDIKTTYTLDEEYLSWQLSIGGYLFWKQNGFEPKDYFAIWIHSGKAKLVPVKKIDFAIVEQFLTAAANGDLWVNPIKNELIGLNSEVQKVLEFEGFIRSLKEEMDQLEKLKSTFLSTIEAQMEAQDLKKWETDNIIITRVLPSQSITIDTKKLKEEQPEIAKKYEKTTDKKGYIKITLK